MISGSNLSEGNWFGQSIFSNTKKLKNSNIKSKKVRKTYEVQKKTKQNKKKQKVYFIMPKSIECAHKKYKKVNTHKK